MVEFYYKDAECWPNRFRVTMLSKVCNREDWYAITHVRSNTMKSLRDAVNLYMLWELIL